MKAAIFSIVREIAPDLQWSDLQDVCAAAMVKAGSCGAQKAVRYALADWLREQTDIPKPTQDTTISEAQYLDTGKRRGRHGELLLRKKREAQQIDEGTWQRMLGRLTEREQQIAVLIVADWQVCDIAAHLKISQPTVIVARKRIKARLADTALWNPILDALYGLPDSMIGRAEFDTDLSEYRTKRTALTRSVFVRGTETEQRQLIFTTWFVPAHAKRQAPMAWYPGMPIRLWEPSKPSGLWASALDLLSFRPKHAGKTSRHTDNQDMADCRLARREASGLAQGRRFFFEHSKNGTMLSCPVIRREFDADGMFRRHCS